MKEGREGPVHLLYMPEEGAVHELSAAPTSPPPSHRKDYTQYQLFDTLQAFCSSLTRLITTRASLKRLGVGDVSATATSATLVYVGGLSPRLC